MAVMVDLNILTDPAVLSELIFQGLVRGAMYALMGIGLSLIFGNLRGSSTSPTASCSCSAPTSCTSSPPRSACR